MIEKYRRQIDTITGNISIRNHNNHNHNMIGHVFGFTQNQTDKIFQKTKFKTIYWYGERYYCAAEVDAHINGSGDGTESNPPHPPATAATIPCKRIDPLPMYINSSELFTQAYSCSKADKEATLNSSLIDANENMESGSVSATEYWNAIANDGTAALSSPRCSLSPTSSPSLCKPAVTRYKPADSPHSVTSSTSAGCGSRGRAIGKRNQEFYLPDGGVRLSHISSGCDDSENDAWFGRYDKKTNTIGRTLDADTDIVIATYETLAHFAQEHDREVHHSDADARDTPNVWKNNLFTFYNTVTCKWEPLSNLRE